MSKEKLVPKLRFKEFRRDNIWELKSLEETVGITMGQSPSSKNYTSNPSDYILVQGNSDLKNGKVSPRIWTTQVTKKANKGDLILSVRAPVGDIGKTDFDVVLGRGVAAITGNEFIFQLLTKMKVNNYWTNLITGSTFESINSNDIKNAKVFFPRKEEQNKIGSFFKQLDEMIQLQQSKVNKVKDIKSAYLSEMFPKEGEKYPERRFEGFQGVWKKVRLEQVLNQSGSGGTPRTTREEYYGGDIPFLGISDITNSNGYIFNTEKTITIKGLNNSAAWIVPKESISLAMYASVGKVAILKIKSATSQAFYNMVINNRPTRDYVYQYLVKMEAENKWDRIISTGTQANLNAEKVRNLIIPIPIDIVEREKIGQFFKKLDNLILVEEEKLSKLRKLKQAYLNDMFV